VKVAQLANTIAANALIGREKSAVLCCLEDDETPPGLRQTLFHELAHIFCAKSEMDGEHFIDIYGSGTPPENPDMTPEERQYDGLLVAGHAIWSEFIAQFFALLFTEPEDYRIADVTGYAKEFVPEIAAVIGGDGKAAFAMVAAALLTCVDANNTRSRSKLLRTLFPQDMSLGSDLRRMFSECLALLQGRLDNEKPWKITEEFIAELGAKYFEFKTKYAMQLWGSFM
jgi:hypothetical protein